jgi:pyruvate dehydrogenase E1 component
LSALGLSHAINGERLLPIGTLYDPFIARGLDALNYACYQDARFILAGTPSGITLAPEGGAHQSIGTPLIGIAQDGLAAFEPAFLDELSAVLAWALAYIQKDEEKEASERNWLRDDTGGSVYLRLSTRPIEQPKREMTPELRQAIIDGAYWFRPPGPNSEVVIAYTGALAPEAIEAVGLMAEDRRDVGLLAVTSADRLNAAWTAASRARERGLVHARSHIERLLANVPSACLMVIRLRSPGSVRCMVIACVRLVSNTSARPVRLPISTDTMELTPTPSSPPRKRSRRGDRSDISKRWGDTGASHWRWLSL